MMRYALTLALLLGASAALAEDEPPRLDADRLPLAWKVTARIDVIEAQRAAIGTKLGVSLETLSNTYVDAGGIRFQVNLARCATEEDAETLRGKFAELHKSPLHAARRGRDAAEIICSNRFVTAKARDLIGWDGVTDTRWKVAVRVAPLARSDDGRWNEFFNALWALERDGGKAETARVEDLAKHFEFGRMLALRAPTAEGFAPKIGTEPEQMGATSGGDRRILTFRELPTRSGVPVVDLSMVVPVRAFSARPAGEVDQSRLIASTAAWPARSATAQRALDEALEPIHDKKVTQRRVVEHLLAWVNANVRYDGEKLGSRYGFDNVLEQGYGHCWDKSDVLITLCRTAHIPAREVFGWIRDVCGHVWVEVYLADEGWLEIDATTTWLGVSDRYVPLALSDDGPVPFVYWSPPTIEPVPE